MRNGMRLGALIVVEITTVAVLHALGELPWMQVPPPDPSSWAHWAGVTPAEDVLAAVARLVALAGAYWLFLSTLCYTAAAAARLPRALRVAGWATLPAVRRVADRAVAVALVTSSVVGASSAAGGFPAAAAPAAAAADPPSVADVAWPPLPPPPPANGGSTPSRPAAPSPPRDEGSPPPPPGAPSPPADANSPSSPRGAPSSPADPLPEPPPPDRGATSERPRPAPATHVVEPGESLWTITVTHLEASGADLDPAAVRAVWREVVDANRDRLRSGDPDLIYPGETVTLSPLPERGHTSST